jgi:4-alpha-glucanotransferase
MNTPSTDSGNWAWRFEAGPLTADLAGRIRNLNAVTGRLVRD